MQIKSLIPYSHQEALVLDIETVLKQCRMIYEEPYCKYDCLAAYWVQTYYLAEVILFLPGAGEELTQKANLLIYNLLDSKMNGKEFTEVCNNFYADGGIRQSIENSFDFIEPDDRLNDINDMREIKRACEELFGSLVSISVDFRSPYTFLLLYNFINHFRNGRKFARLIKGGGVTLLGTITPDVEFDLMSGAISSMCTDKGRASTYNNKLLSFVKDNKQLPLFQVDYNGQLNEKPKPVNKSAASALLGSMPSPQ